MLIDHELKVVFHSLPGANFYALYWWAQIYIPHRYNIEFAVPESLTLTPMDQLYALPETLPEDIRADYTHVLILRDPSERLEQVCIEMMDHPEGARWLNTRRLTTIEDVWNYAASHPEETLAESGDRLPWFREQITWVEQLKGCKIEAIEYRDVRTEFPRFLARLGYGSRPTYTWPVRSNLKEADAVANQLFERDLPLFGLAKTSDHFGYVYKQESELPFVSVLTPTYKRHKFLPLLEQCLLRQTYPRDRFEWIIIDDSPEEFEDFKPSDQLNTRYVRLSSHTILGAKRNQAVEMATGSLLVPCDDDDYMPAQRLEHAVKTMADHPEAMLAYCKDIPMYHLEEEIFVVGSVSSVQRSFGGTWVFRKMLSADRKYGLTKHAEELNVVDRHLPAVELDPWQTILSFAHDANTVSRDRTFKKVDPSAHRLENYVPSDLLERYLALKSK